MFVNNNNNNEGNCLMRWENTIIIMKKFGTWTRINNEVGSLCNKVSTYMRLLQRK